MKFRHCLFKILKNYKIADGQTDRQCEKLYPSQTQFAGGINTVCEEGGGGIENLYDKAQSAVLFNGSTGEWFRTTVGVRQGYLLSPTLFNIFLERIV